MPLRFLFLPLIALMTPTACETIEGAGRDIKGAGESITDQSQETQAEM